MPAQTRAGRRERARTVADRVGRKAPNVSTMGAVLSFFEFLARRSDDMLELGLQHVAVVAIAVALSSIIGIGLGIAVYRTRRARDLLLAAAGVTLTVPSFALFVLFIGPFGLGPVPVVLALTLYGLLPILRNTIAGLRGVDPSVVE